MNIYLVRHGEAASSWGQSSDPGLSELGRQQAQQSADRLRSELGESSELVSSPLSRAQETAAPLAQLLQRPVSIEKAYREIPAPVPMEQRQDWLRKFMRERWNTQPDSLLQWRERAYRQLLGLQQDTAVFTHFLVINAIVGQVLERAETLYFWPDNGSITHLRHTGESLELVELGEQMETVVN